MRKLTKKEISNLKSDIADYLDDGFVLVETTFAELAAQEVGTLCGAIGNKCFKKVSEKYPCMRVRGAFGQDEFSGKNVVCSCEILLPNGKNGSAIGRDIERCVSAANGSLRFDDGMYPGDEKKKSRWYYFECE